MRNQSIRALVLKSVPLRQKDRLIHLLCEKYGLLVAMAYGSASSKSQLQAVTMPFVLADFQLFFYRDRITIDRGDLIEAFLPLQQDIEKLTAAAHLSQIALDALVQGVAEPNIYRLWGYSLFELSRSGDPVLTSQVAALRLLSDLGYAPWLNNCVVCHKGLDTGAYFSLPDSGIICDQEMKDIAPGRRVYLSYPTISSLIYIVRAPYNLLFNFTVSAEVRGELLNFVELYLEEKMEKQYTRLNLIKSFDNFLPTARKKEDKPKED